ncbi:MAG: flavodoxin domain-containing protein [Candidatus Thalassarchaeaceae archaeon]|jgi:succinate dehydrogenase/fumarate reductase-like Fe-S protein/flavodoxin|nr:flavodoxin domain-containing protein [Candidatus Thalassarchaeaceae archaeon]
MSAVVKVWIDEGCITCDACENICPEVFLVEDDTCIIVDGINPGEWGDDIIEAAEGCPVDVIMYEVADGDAAPPAEDTPAEVVEEVVTAEPEAIGEGALAGVMAGDRDLHILFGSQSGNAESLCSLIAKKATGYGLVGHVHDMDGFDLASMSGMKRVLIACSTWGEGEQPDNAEALFNAAKGAGKTLSNTHFSVCALGDSSYEFYCQSGKEWDEVLAVMGGSRIHDRVDCDVDYDLPAAAWMAEALSRIACVDDSGTFHEDLVAEMIAHAAGDTASASSGDVATVAMPEIQLVANIFRYNADKGETGVDAWACAIPGHHSVLDLLRTLKATQDGTLTFRDGAADDPTTGVSVNGRLVLPGLTRLCDVVRDKGQGSQIRIEPVAAYDVIRDLVVDYSSYDNLRAASKPWFVGRQREGTYVGNVAMGTMDAVVATELHTSNDISSPQLLHATSDTVPYNRLYMGPAMVCHLWNRSCDPRISDSSRTAIIESLAATNGVKSETDMASIHRQGSMGKIAAKSVLQAKTAVLSHDGYNGRHGKHVWWYTWSIKSSGMVNETTLYRTVLGPMGLVNNALSGVSARMIFGFTRTGRPMFNELLGMVAPPAGIGKMPKQFNSSVENHHEVISIFNEMDGRF